MNSIYPIDIWSVKKNNAEKWLNKLPAWPVSDNEFLSLYKDIDDLYSNTIINASPEIGDSLSVLYKLTIEYTESLHAALVTKRLLDAGFTAKYEKGKQISGYYDGFAKKSNKFQGLFHKKNNKLWPSIPQIHKRIIGRLKTLVRDYKHNKYSIFHYFTLIREPYYFALYFPSEELEKYASQKRKRIRQIYPFPIINLRTKKSKIDSLELSRTLDYLQVGLEKIVVKYGVKIQGSFIVYLCNLTKECLKCTQKVISAITAVLEKKERASILVEGLGNTLVRCLCIAAKRKGYTVIGVNHGNSMGIFNDNSFANTDLSLTDIYLTHTKGAADLFLKAKNEYPLSRRKNSKIISIDSNKYKRIWNENKQKTLPSEIKSVMFLEYPLTEFRHKNVFAFWPYQLRFLLQVAIAMRKLGVNTIIKRHPDRLTESEGLYEKYFDILLKEPFETVYEKADAFFFPNLTSTTFGFALLTNRPIIIFDTMLNDIWEDVRELIRRRCRVIPSYIKPDGTISFDEEALSETLRKKPEQPDTEFIQKYMLS